MTCVATAQGLGTGCDTLFSQVRKLPCRYPLVAHVVRNEVVHGYVIFSSLFLSSPRFSLTAFSVNSLQFLYFAVVCCCSLFSSHFFQIFLNTILPSHSRCWACDLFAIVFISHSVPFVRPISDYSSPVSLK